MGDESHPAFRAQELFDEFVSAATCRAALGFFGQLCEHLQLDPSASERPLYRPIKRRLNYWKANALWAKLDRRAAQPEYMRARACNNITVRIYERYHCRSNSTKKHPLVKVEPLPVSLCVLSHCSVCDHRRRALWSKDGGGAELHGSSSGAARKERLFLQEQRSPPVALHYPRPPRPWGQKVLWKVLCRDY